MSLFGFAQVPGQSILACDQVGVEVTGAQTTFSMGTEGPDAPQRPGKGVAHLVVALKRQLTMLVHRLIAPFGAIP